MRTTLQARLIGLLILSSLFLVSTFTAIQLNNQIEKTREFNIYQARQGALSLKDKLQEIFQTFDEQKNKAALMNEIKSIFNTALESGVAETISLINKDGYPEILEGNLQLFFEDEKTMIEGISASGDSTRWMIPQVDRKHKLTNIFVIFDNPSGYVLKLTFSLSSLQKALNEVYVPIFFTVLMVIAGNILLGALLSWVVISPIKILNQATKDIASGNLDLRIHISTKDELEELSDTFNYMTIELKKMKARAENANPLTKLPGNIVIQEEVEKRIKGDKKFVLLYCDLDNFKAFNDKYGVHAGDEAIMLTADIFKESIAKSGSSDDFIGHEGGDDFLLLTSPENAEAIAEYILKEFGGRIKNLYSKEDIQKGYIEAKARDRDQIVRFPVMTISLAGVSNVRREITSYAQATNIAADVKKIAKKGKEGKFVMDRRVGEENAMTRDIR